MKAGAVLTGQKTLGVFWGNAACPGLSDPEARGPTTWPLIKPWPLLMFPLNLTLSSETYLATLKLFLPDQVPSSSGSAGESIYILIKASEDSSPARPRVHKAEEGVLVTWATGGNLRGYMEDPTVRYIVILAHPPPMMGAWTAFQRGHQGLGALTCPGLSPSRSLAGTRPAPWPTSMCL